MVVMGASTPVLEGRIAFQFLFDGRLLVDLWNAPPGGIDPLVFARYSVGEYAVLLPCARLVSMHSYDATRCGFGTLNDFCCAAGCHMPSFEEFRSCRSQSVGQ